MILVVAAGSWLAGFILVTLVPRFSQTARRELQLDLAAMGGLGIATLGFFWRLLLGQVWMPAGGGDLAGFLYPTYRFAQEWWRRGVIPLWNPYLFAGQPFVGDIQSGIFYPFNLLTFFLTNPLTYRDLELLAVLHYLIAGVGMYALLRWGTLIPSPSPPFGRGLARSLTKEEGVVTHDYAQPDDAQRGVFMRPAVRVSRAACLAGALAFEFSDLFITHFGNLNLIASAAWLPFVFLFFARAIDSDVRGWSLGFGSWSLDFGIWKLEIASGLFLALSFLAGHIQSFLFVLLALGLYALYHMVECRRAARHTLGALGVTLAVGLGLGALVLLPGIEMTRASVRSTFTYENAAEYSLPPTELVGLLIPGFFGRGPQAAWGPWDRVEVGYLGVFPLLLAALAVLLRRDSRTRFFALLALVGLILALGGYSILHGWLYAVAPVFGQLRAPARFIYLLDFGLAVLAALGLDALVQPLNAVQARTFRVISRNFARVSLLVALVSGGVALALLALGQGQDPTLYQRIGRAANSIFFFILLLAFSNALLLWRARQNEPDFSSPNSRLETTAARPLWSALALALIVFDLFSLGAYVDIGLGDPTAEYNRQDVIDFLQSQGGVYRIDSITDVAGTWMPDTAALYGLYDVNGDNPLVLSSFKTYWESLGGREGRAYDLLNVKYVIARRNTPLPSKFKRAFDGAANISVYENLNALPRAWLSYTGDKTGENLTVNPPGEGSPPAEAQIVGYGPNEIDLEVNAQGQSYLVLSEVYYPGWRAVVDGQETEILRADNLFRAVLLPPGAHQIRFIYDPLSFKLGAAISGVTLLGLAGLVVYGWRKGRVSLRL
jgi:Bacterial membrane protein YfhO